MVNFTVFLHNCYIVNSLKRFIEEKKHLQFARKLLLPNFYNLILTLFRFSVYFTVKFNHILDLTFFHSKVSDTGLRIREELSGSDRQENTGSGSKSDHRENSDPTVWKKTDPDPTFEFNNLDPTLILNYFYLITTVVIII